MEHKIIVTQCDVCGREKNNSYSYLQKEKWTKYKVCKDWCLGGNAGETKYEIIVCPKCDNKKGMKYFFYKILKPLTMGKLK